MINPNASANYSFEARPGRGPDNAQGQGPDNARGQGPDNARGNANGFRPDTGFPKQFFGQIGELLPRIADKFQAQPVPQNSVGDGTGPLPGEILGGTNEFGDFIDPVTADFTRDNFSGPVSDLSINNLGQTEDGKTRIEVRIDNPAADGGLYLTPAFVGVSDGSFDLFNNGEAASAGLEALAEDGTSDQLAAEFAEATGGAGVSGVLQADGGGPLAPGTGGSLILEVDPTRDRFLNFAQMILPSNDAFVSSGDDPMAVELFDADGNFVAKPVTFDGTDVYDAGTEVNTEMDAAFINQTAPNTGIDENGTVQRSDGFIGSVGQSQRAVDDLSAQLREIGAIFRQLSSRY